MDVCAYWFWLVMVFGPANRRLWKLSLGFDTVERFASAVKENKIESLFPKEVERAAEISFIEAAEIVDEYRANGISVYCYESEGYPEKLRDTANPPAVIFLRGSLDFLANNTLVDFAGAREPSSYSAAITRSLSDKLSSKGCAISSGLAVGIDQIAVKAALDGGYPVLAVVGLSIDLYEDDPFASEIEKHGAILSENCERFENPRPRFSERNRLIAALSDAVIFVEGSSKSRGLDLCEQTIAAGKYLFVVPPHDITDDRYSGQAWLIRRGCKPLFSDKDVLFYLAHGNVGMIDYEGIGGIYSEPGDYSFFRDESPETDNDKPRPRNSIRSSYQTAHEEVDDISEPKDFSQLEDTDRSICELLEKEPLLADVISAKLGMSISDVLAHLTILEFNGFVESLPGKRYRLS